MEEIKSITNIGSNKWLVNFLVPVPCGCYFDREALIIESDVKPTKEKARNEIKNRKRR